MFHLSSWGPVRTQTQTERPRPRHLGPALSQTRHPLLHASPPTSRRPPPELCPDLARAPATDPANIRQTCLSGLRALNRHLVSPATPEVSETMSGRKLGGGRVLGSGKGLAPPPASPANGPRASSPFAPSDAESTVSMHSRNSTQNSISPLSSSPLPDFSQDLTANISLAGPSNGAAADNELLCPICGEQMVCPNWLACFSHSAVSQQI